MEVLIQVPCGATRSSILESIQNEFVAQGRVDAFDFEDIIEVGNQVDYLLASGGGGGSRLSITITLKFKKWSLSLTIEF